MNTGEHPDQPTVEAIADWLELCIPSGQNAQAWQLRALADALRNGTWLRAAPVRNPTQVLLGRVDDKLRRRAPLTEVERVVWQAREDRRSLRQAAAARSTDRMIAALERLANTGHDDG